VLSGLGSKTKIISYGNDIFFMTGIRRLRKGNILASSLYTGMITEYFNPFVLIDSID
jgi:hypothetical protein